GGRDRGARLPCAAPRRAGGRGGRQLVALSFARQARPRHARRRRARLPPGSSDRSTDERASAGGRRRLGRLLHVLPRLVPILAGDGDLLLVLGELLLDLALVPLGPVDLDAELGLAHLLHPSVVGLLERP